MQETLRPRVARLRALRGPLGAALVALPHRHQRLPRHARRPRAPRPPDGPRPRARAGDRPACTTLPEVDVDRAGAGRPRAARTGDPAEVAVGRESIRLAFVAALQHLPPRQRAVLILREVLRWQAAEVARAARHDRRVGEQRAPAGPRDARGASTSPPATRAPSWTTSQRALLARYVEAFERYDMDALTALLHEDATQSMPPYDLWLRGRDDIVTWWLGPGHRLPGLAAGPDRRGERLARLRAVQAERTGRRLRAVGAPGARALRTGGSPSSTFFLDTDRLFPLFGLPLEYRRARRSRAGP